MQPLDADDPQRIGAYTLHNRLGRGAMGTVYLGISPGGRPVAVKVARAELADDPEFRERFRREVEMARSVGGFWTAAVVDADPDAPRPWLATEYVPGPTLQQAVSAHGPLPEEAVRRLAAGLTEALAAIHAAGLIHRDLKPSNVLLGADGPRVIDFGISQALERAKLTATGAFLGTPGFLSPEQIAGEDVGPASDVFALGAVLVYAATGCGPYGDGQTSALMYRAVHTEPRLAEVPGGLRQLVAACLHRDPRTRPAPAALLAELGPADPPPATAPSWLPAPIQTLVDRYRTQLRDQTVGPSAALTVPSTAVVTSTNGPTPTRPYTRVVQPDQPAHGGSPAAAAPVPGGYQGGGSPRGSQGQSPVAYDGGHTGGVRFGTSRINALGWGSAALVATLICSGIADRHSGAPGLIRLGAFVGFVMFGLATVRLLLAAVRRPLTLEVGAEGLTVAKGRDRWQLPWYAVARTRIVTHGSRPWLAVWLAPGVLPPRALGGAALRKYHGGVRLYPVAHERRRKRRARELRELRAALAWHGPQAYDRSP